MTDMLRAQQISYPHLHDPEEVTSKIGQSVILDLNDPRLLIDNRNALQKINTSTPGRSAKTNLTRRYNISNDSAYDMLKENHQSKVRSTLGNLALDHSMPAIKLQWPFVSAQI